MTVHEATPRQDSLVVLIKLLILDLEAESPWTAGATSERRWLDCQLRLHTAGIAENVVAQHLTLSEVRGTILDEWRVDTSESNEVNLHFVCRSASRNRALGLDNRPMIVR